MVKFLSPAQGLFSASRVTLGSDVPLASGFTPSLYGGPRILGMHATKGMLAESLALYQRSKSPSCDL